MRLIKMLGLAAVAAVAAMAFLGASSAMATFPTSLCDEASETLECPEGQRVHLFTMLAGTSVLTTSLLTVLCLHSKAAVEVTSEKLLGEPLLLKTEELTWENWVSTASRGSVL